MFLPSCVAPPDDDSFSSFGGASSDGIESPTMKPLEVRRKFLLECIDKVLDLIEDESHDCKAKGTDRIGKHLS